MSLLFIGGGKIGMCTNIEFLLNGVNQKMLHEQLNPLVKSNSAMGMTDTSVNAYR